MSTVDVRTADPVFVSQSVFRATMDALAQPGTRRPLVGDAVPPAPMTAELAALALMLCDHDAPVWLAGTLSSSEAVRDWLAFHTGAPIAAEPQLASFALATNAEDLPSFDRFNQGTDEYPDRSTTIILAVPSFEGGTAMTLRGPGIESETVIAPSGLPADFIAQRARNRERFPCGVDLLLVAPGEVLGLPRTTRIGS